MRNPRNDGPVGTVYDYYGRSTDPSAIRGNNCAVLIVYVDSSDTEVCVQRKANPLPSPK